MEVFVLMFHCAAQSTMEAQVARTALLEQAELYKARYKVLTAVLIAFGVFLIVTPCLLVNIYRSPERSWCLYCLTQAVQEYISFKYITDY